MLARSAEDPGRQPEPKLVTKRCRLDKGRSSEWLQSPKIPPGRKSVEHQSAAGAQSLKHKIAMPGAGRIGEVLASEYRRAMQKFLKGSQKARSRNRRHRDGGTDCAGARRPDRNLEPRSTALQKKGARSEAADGSTQSILEGGAGGRAMRPAVGAQSPRVGNTTPAASGAAGLR